jgi:hypothetical protein
MRRYHRVNFRNPMIEVRLAPSPVKVNMRTVIKHRRRKVLGNERSIGMVLYRGTITRKGVRALELRDVEM